MSERYTGVTHVITCEHASNAVPAGVELGVSPQVLVLHNAWDPGAVEVAVELSHQLGATLIQGRYTRMFVDLNRSPHNPAVIPVNAFGVPVPGNVNLSEAQRQARLARWHEPHRQAVLAEVRAGIARGCRVVHVAMHSYTPKLGDEVRDYPLGVLYDPARSAERALADEIVAAFTARGLDCRHNQPYPGTGDGLGVWLRALFPDPDLASVEFELSQALHLEEMLAVGRVLAGVLADHTPSPSRAAAADRRSS